MPSLYWMPAFAGMTLLVWRTLPSLYWMPAFAGMTSLVWRRLPSHRRPKSGSVSNHAQPYPVNPVHLV